jgi:hypothetical protein
MCSLGRALLISIINQFFIDIISKQYEQNHDNAECQKERLLKGFTPRLDTAFLIIIIYVYITSKNVY